MTKAPLGGEKPAPTFLIAAKAAAGTACYPLVDIYQKMPVSSS
jgi:hypothetical protein